jgi:hypothetical protein
MYSLSCMACMFHAAVSHVQMLGDNWDKVTAIVVCHLLFIAWFMAFPELERLYFLSKWVPDMLVSYLVPYLWIYVGPRIVTEILTAVELAKIPSFPMFCTIAAPHFWNFMWSKTLECENAGNTRSKNQFARLLRFLVGCFCSD